MLPINDLIVYLHHHYCYINETWKRLQILRIKIFKNKTLNIKQEKEI